MFAGAPESALGRTVSSYQNWIRIAGGILMMVFGIHLTGLLSIIPLYRELRFKFEPKKTGLAAAFLMGIVFAVGWTPCVGPILAAILIYSASEATVGKGIVMLACYSAGIGTPFLMASGFLPQFQKFIKKIKPHLQEIEIGSGILIILLGVLLITNRLGFLTSLL
ncbi:MAG: hypothetical protein HY747_08065 [Elusimicrobia bacterium]|nr:hypothetical protein [Elusimicrobiota bacterium]